MKIIYGLIGIILIFVLFNFDQYKECKNQENIKHINRYSQKFYREYMEKYKNKYPNTLEFIAVRNLGFIPIYYINLDRSSDRRKLLERDFQDYGIKAKRISGIDGKKINPNPTGTLPNISVGSINGIKYQLKNTNISTYELGCTLSHLKAISQAYKDGHELALIAEDDIGLDLIPHWDKTLHQIIDEFPTEWTIVNLNTSCYLFNDEKISSYRKRQCWLTTVYIINRKGMELILNMEKDGVFILEKAEYGICQEDASADCYIYSVIPHTYGYNKPLFYARPFSTTVGSSNLSNSMGALWKIKNFVKQNTLKNQI